MPKAVYLVYEGDNALNDAKAVLFRINQALGITNYAAILTDGQGRYAVPIIGPRVTAVLTDEERSATIDLQTPSDWRPVQ